MFSPRHVDHHEQAARSTHADRDKSPLVQIGCIIRDRDGIGIVKDRNRLRHPDAVLAEVDADFARVIPLEAHTYSVRTFCAYVKGEPWSPPESILI